MPIDPILKQMLELGIDKIEIEPNDGMLQWKKITVTERSGQEYILTPAPTE